MKSNQTTILLCALIAVVFGVTFASQWVSDGKDGKKIGSVLPVLDDSRAARLEIPPQTPADNLLVEMHPATGGFDFWFRNKNDTPIELALHERSCKCARVEVRLLTREEEQEIRNGARYGATQMLMGSAGTLPLMTASAAVAQRFAFLEKREPWKPLDEKTSAEHPAVIPPQATGFVRIGWDGKEAKPQRIKATLRTNAPGDDAQALTILELAVRFVPAVQVHSPTLTLPTPIRAGKSSTTSLYCWTHTRAGFDVRAEEKNHDPCFECETIPVDPEELQPLAGKDAPPVRAGYRIKITVHSQRGDHHMDLGPFFRKLNILSEQLPEWLSDADISGAVEGNIRVISEGGKNVADLEDFRSSEGKKKSVTLESDSGVELQVDESATAPPYLKVKLENAATPAAAGRRQWRLSLAVPNDRAAGRLPPSSGVTLKTNEKPPRRIRIPVRGHASN
jgi:hypothetical protein